MPADFDAHRDLLSCAPVGCLLLDDGVIVAVNDQAIATMAIPRERLEGVALAELLVPDFEDSYSAFVDRLGEGPASLSVRLAAGLAPLELRARRVAAGRLIVAVRSMEREHHYSAMAGGDLTHDVVTGLPNHFHVLSQLHQRLTAPKRLPMAIMCLWVDELQDLADVHGNRAIERVVKEVGGRLQNKLRAPDVLGRFEEAGFLVMMTTDSTAGQLTEVAERLRDEIAFPVELDNALVSFTASVVVGSITNQRPSIERVLALLEAAANRAVISGGNRTDVLAI
ncbi:MAG: diguanylate cyclase [Acidimicrobiia bacterium]|nr:diguanylate cyclase [Acidimicrobiia bacterium]